METAFTKNLDLNNLETKLPKQHWALISEMKITFFYTVTFLAFLLANPSMAVPKFI